MQRRLTPSWQLTIPLLAGLLGFIGASLTDSLFVLAPLVLAFLFAAQTHFKTEKIEVALKVFGAALILFWLAAWRTITMAPAYDSVAFLPQQEISIKGTISDYRPREEFTQLVLNDIKYGTEKRSDKVLLTMQQPISFWQVGDELIVSCRAQIPESESYKNYLSSQGIYLTCTTREEPVHLGRAVTPNALAWQLRMNFEEAARARFAEPYATLLIGLYIGDVSFSEQYQDIFKTAGISHIVAASGSNVSLTVALVLGLLATLGIRRQDAFWWVLGAVIGFVIISGMSAPVIRAGIMGLLILIGATMGRKASMRNIFLLTITAMLFVKPLWLLYDVGFQLSVGSTWGLLYLSSYFKRAFKFIPETLGLREAMSTTTAATIATAPILVGSFGQFSLLAPFANLLILPALPYVLTVGAAALVAPVHAVFIAAPWLGLEWILRVSDVLSTLSFGLIATESITARIAISTVFICLIIAIYFHEQRRVPQL